MALRRPLVVIDGRIHELPFGDSTPGAVPTTGTPLRLLGFDANGDLHEVAVAPGLLLETGLLSLSSSGGDNLDGGYAGALFGPGDMYDGGNAGTTTFGTSFDGGYAGTALTLDGGGAGATFGAAGYDGGNAGAGTTGSQVDGSGA